MKEQTAVEWLVEQITNGGISVRQAIQQAKAMEREQIEDAYDYGFADGFDDVKYDDEPKGAEKYYNETFNKSINNKG